MKARSALFTVFGDLVRPAGGEAWLSTLTACMETLDFSAPAVRTALHRMTAEGWVEPRKAGRYAAYRLTEKGVARLEEAATRIYRLKGQEWDGRWRLLLCPTLRDGDTLAALEWLGYGLVQDGVWAHPHPHPESARSLVSGVPGLESSVEWLDEVLVEDSAALAARAWELEELRDGHTAFLERWSGVTPSAEPGEAMGMRLRLIHEWRSFLFQDPGLPTDVLGEDWPGADAALVFARVYEQLQRPSWRFYVEQQESVPAEGPDLTVIADHNPFAKGLSVMQRG
ncbi:PaaX family transcriptional regulator C-terminal domain-containing protein [Euzebya tangerina]|uniref:PaaX family transcriptional regulator n=1 Tax=Euzebya tangerina TaxID=591198 RepID=UPI000E30BC45|nr:PaaX family transcriptional regulator C-terminal domain-containing protein [Euzebya tangerina]